MRFNSLPFIEIEIEKVREIEIEIEKVRDIEIDR
jgi:hypothetical protein